MGQTDRHPDRLTTGHGDSMTKTMTMTMTLLLNRPSWADSVKKRRRKKYIYIVFMSYAKFYLCKLNPFISPQKSNKQATL